MASTRVFPAEILSHIFSYVLHDVEREECNCQCDFVRLGHICSEWRDIINSTPLLWSKFRVDIAKELYDETRIFEAVPYLPLLLLYVKTSGNCPFRLDVAFPPSYNSTEEVLEKLEQCVPNVHTLTILRMPWESEISWSSWLSVESLKIQWESSWTDDPELHISFVDFTHLRRLDIHHSMIPTYIQLSGEQMTRLELVDVAVDLCMSLLLQCPNLVNFRAVNTPRPEFHRVLQRPEPTRNLECLSWDFRSDSACNSLYHQLRFPSFVISPGLVHPATFGRMRK